jgi:hypothetical protein
MEALLADEVLEHLEVLVGLAREADDERRPQRDVGEPPADPIEDPLLSRPTDAAPHRLEHRPRRVLERHVEVAADLGLVPDRVEQAFGNSDGVRVVEADPLDAVDLRERRQSLPSPVPSREVAAVRRRVLAHEVEARPHPAPRGRALRRRARDRALRIFPRSVGMMQNAQRWSQPR